MTKYVKNSANPHLAETDPAKSSLSIYKPTGDVHTATIDHFSTVLIIEKKPIKIEECEIVSTCDSLDWYISSTINDALRILGKQNPHVAGLQSICSSGDHFIPKHSHFLQILRKKDRYVLVSTYDKKNGHVDLFDPMNKCSSSSVSKNTKLRISNLLIHHNVCSKLYINVMKLDHNFDFKHSGLICLAMILVLLKGLYPNSLLFEDTERIKHHMASCLKSKRFTVWFSPEDWILKTRFPYNCLPPIGQFNSPRTETHIEIDMYCLCHRPLDEYMLHCEGCNNPFHPVCVMKFGSIKKPRNRDILKLWCPDCIEKPKDTLLAQLPHLRYEYDAYISYCGTDLWFVKKLLIPYLEKRGRRNCYKLMISERDFMAGASMVDEIIEKMAQCRKCIVIGSRHYFKANLKSFEWDQMARHKWYSIKIILLDSVDALMDSSWSESFNECLMRRHFIEWKEDFNDIQYLTFWEQLRRYLGEPLMCDIVC